VAAVIARRSLAVSFIPWVNYTNPSVQCTKLTGVYGPY